MNTAFDKPQWRWQRTSAKMKIGGMSNVVEITDMTANTQDKYQSRILATVPAEFYKWVNDVLGYDDLTGMLLYLDKRPVKGNWVFGVQRGNDYWDLWDYGTSCPRWVNES